MKKYIKVITGYRQDQHYTIDAEEAHKAYYLFMNPEMRGVFNNGVALIGRDIRSIEPDYHATMGWNSTHYLDSDDWNELNSKGVVRKLRTVVSNAQLVAKNNPELINISLTDASRQLALPDADGNNGLKQIGDIMGEFPIL